MQQAFIYAAAGGILIGLASILLLWGNGRIAGISGIVSGLLTPGDKARGWRLAFTLGLVVGGAALLVAFPAAFPDSFDIHPALAIAAGLLVGFGTRLGSGCTSGHGVCGMSRFSARSIVAVAVFMGTGVLTVTLLTALQGGL